MHRETFADTGGFEVTARHEGHFAVGWGALEEVAKPPMEVRVEDVFAIEGEDVLPEVVEGFFRLALHAGHEGAFASHCPGLADVAFGIDDDLITPLIEGLLDGGRLGGWLRRRGLEFEHSQFPFRGRLPQFD